MVSGDSLLSVNPVYSLVASWARAGPHPGTGTGQKRRMIETESPLLEGATDNLTVLGRRSGYARALAR